MKRRQKKSKKSTHQDQKIKYKTKQVAYLSGVSDGSTSALGYWKPKIELLEKELKDLKASSQYRELDLRERALRSLGQIAEAVAKVANPGAW